MVEIAITYEGDLHCRATHIPSGAVMTTDAPVENHGKGESFSPTDLVATALGTCILSVMGIAARSMGIELSGAKATVQKDMVAKPVRRLGVLAVTIDIPTPLSEAQQQRLIVAAMTCPVHKSLHPDIQMPIEFRWAGRT
jgi:putative redox protein